ncbi:armadillo-type protein [Lipomyces kononenkoae]|uniref:Armadillo-type protein n=1 Tax=Lipomyces kononenkoae TaxID=34357 RepID=A0ACC3T9M9_LIPKO
MGKAKKLSRNSLLRVSALRGSRAPAVPGPSTNPAAQQQAIPLIEKLSSANPKDRALAASAIANVIDNAVIRRALLKEKLVQTVLEQSLTDSSEEVAVEGFGVLRNLALEEGYDVCVFVWRKDILAIVLNYLEKIKTDIAHLKDSSAAQKTLLFNLIENILSLLTSLGRSSDEICDSIVSRLPSLPIFVLDILANHAVPESVKAIAAENLYILSEANGAYIEQIQTSGFVSDGKLGVAVQMYLCGVQYNIFETSRTASIDLLDIVRSVYEGLRGVDIKEAIKIMQPVTVNGVVRPPTYDDNYRSAENSFIAAQVGLELITDISEALVMKSQNGRPSRQMDTEEDNDDNDDVDEMEVMEDENQMAIEDETMDGVDNPVLALLLEDVLPFVTGFIDHQELRSRALLALNNMTWTFNSLVPHWANSKADGLWSRILNLLLSSDDLDLESRTGSVGILWACGKLKRKFLPEIGVNEVRRFIKAFQDSGESQEVLEFKVRVVGFLGVLALPHEDIDVTKEISVFLLTQVLAVQHKPAEIVIEALNAIYDVFADKSYAFNDEIFVKGEFLNHLTKIQPQVKQMAKKIDRRKYLQLRTKADEVVVNLQRFIAYKAKESKERR